jgi:hypothetical protein
MDLILFRRHEERMKLSRPPRPHDLANDDDYEAMARAGIVGGGGAGLLAGQPRTHVGTFEDYFLGPPRLGALPGQPVRKSAISSTLALKPQGGQQQALRGGSAGPSSPLPREGRGRGGGRGGLR